MNDLAPASLAPALDAIRAVLGDRLTTATAVREQHGKDQTYHPGAPPDAVGFPHSTEEVSAIVKVCAAHRLPVIAVRHRAPRSKATSRRCAAASRSICRR